MPISFSPKLRLAPLWPAAAALVALTIFGLGVAPGLVARSAARDLQATARLLAPMLPLPEGPPPYHDLQRRVHELVSEGPYRITVIGRDGTVYAESERSEEGMAQMENHLHRPEVQEALDHGEGSSVRRSATTGLDTAYAARLVTDVRGRSWIFRVAKAVEALADLRRSVMGMLLAAVAIAILAAAVISLWIERSLFRPLSSLIESSHRIALGDYRAPIPESSESELAALGRALTAIEREAEAQIAAIETERDHLRATVEGMTEGVLVADGAGHVRMLNPAFRELFGVRSEGIGATILELVREPVAADLVERALRLRESASATVERGEPVRRKVALHASPLAADPGAVLVARDITEAERLSEMRRDFVANVSHELKTPLAAIRGYAETIADGAAADPQTASKFIGRILEQCARLEALLADLLTLSRLEGHDTIDVREHVDLRAIAEEAVEMVAAPAAQRNVSIRLEPGASPEIDGDADGLLRLFSNLLENAVKYNRPGGTVTVRLGESDDRIVAEVADTGIGIPKSALSRLFERFFRVDKGRSREEGGTGLGLAIVKHVAQAHGGSVDVESEPGKGSTFRVFLPRSASATV